jgi:hypothetical protein
MAFQFHALASLLESALMFANPSTYLPSPDADGFATMMVRIEPPRQR